jgi:hypothetical protein
MMRQENWNGNNDMAARLPYQIHAVTAAGSN